MHLNKIRQIERFVAETMGQVPPGLALAHDFKHADRVRCWATLIASAEGVADLELVEATALLHDVGLAYVHERKDHAAVGAKVAAEYLQEHNLFAAREVLSIAEAIRCHTLLQGGGQLGQILRDADILDLLGAVGIVRAFTSKHMKPEYDPHDVKGRTWGMTADDFTRRFQSGVGVGPTIIDQINFQISCFDNLQTDVARQLAQPRVLFMQSFLLQLEQEVASRTWDEPTANKEA